MKILFSCIVFICFTAFAYAQDTKNIDSAVTNSHVYTVETTDIYAYANKNGKWEEDAPIVGRFEINEKEMFIRELNTIIDLDGKKIDVAKYNPVEWEIIRKKRGIIVAIRAQGNGEDMLCFMNDGTYYLFQAFHNVPMIELEFAGSFFYGKYKRIEQ